MHETTAHSLREIEDKVSSLMPNVDLCYRGQSESDWKLIPSAYRPLIPFISDPGIGVYWAGEVERDTYRAFDLNADKELRGLDILERLSRAQHHGVPTRLLDWTGNLDVATFFALSSPKELDASIWCLNLTDYPFPAELGRQHRGGGFRLDNIKNYGHGAIATFAQPVSKTVVGSSDQEEKVHPPSTFIVWKPHRVDKRLARQDGFLSWYHTFDEEDVVWNYSEHIKEIEKAEGLELLLKINIPAKKRNSVFKEVLRRGTNEHDLFDDLDGLGKYLSRIHNETLTLHAKS